jgi:hypothetical protein
VYWPLYFYATTHLLLTGITVIESAISESQRIGYNLKMIDPKPRLSAAAISSNIEYYKSICSKYRAGYKDAKQQLNRWEQALENLSSDSNRTQLNSLRPNRHDV